jgi:hypothetical protein
MDNGCLELHSVRIPRANLAQRFVRVSREGAWSRVEGTHPKAAYVTMMQASNYVLFSICSIVHYFLLILIFDRFSNQKSHIRLFGYFLLVY